MLKKGDKAPKFHLEDQDGQSRALSDYKGQWLLIYFYPKDNTPGCTKEACGFRDNYAALKQHVSILGVSSNSVKSHQNFSKKFKLPFPLLADSDKKMINEYGANGLLFAKRVSFLINPKGRINKIYKKVNTISHADDVLKDIKKIQNKYR